MSSEIDQKIQLINVATEKEDVIKFGINRKEENREVLAYSATGNESIFEQVYNRRKPNIDYLAKRYAWLSEDSGSEIRMVFVKTVRQYGKNGKSSTDFNTFFYSSVKNHFVNVLKRRYRKKRTTFDGIDPMNRMVSLDECVNDDENSQVMHEFISEDNQKAKMKNLFDDCFYNLASGNDFLYCILKSIVGLTRRQISKESLVLEYNFTILSDDIIEDVKTQVGVPQSIFNIIDAKKKSDHILAQIKIDSKKLFSFLEERVRGKKSSETIY